MTNEIQKYLAEIAEGNHLSQADSGRMFQIIMNAGATPAQIAAALMGLRINGETVEEITGAAMALRQKMAKLPVSESMQSQIIDCCGTGGDKKGTYNISTAVAIVAAACGVPVAKHGNKAISSRSGSADVLKALGANIDTNEEQTLECLKQAGICFMMAPHYHPAMKNVAPVRLELKMRTIFNILGPLINPAQPERQLLGVYSKEWVAPLANVLEKLGSKHAWVVHGADGMDEITIMDKTHVAELKDGKVSEFTINPEEYGIEIPEDENALSGSGAVNNAQAMKAVLHGPLENDRYRAYRDIILINAGAALVVGGEARDLHHGITLAANAIDNGRAKATLEKLVEISNLQEA